MVETEYWQNLDRSEGECGWEWQHNAVHTVVFDLDMRIPALSRFRCNVPIVDPRLRRSAATWHPSRPTRAGQYLSPQLYSDRLDVLFDVNRP